MAHLFHRLLCTVACTAVLAPSTCQAGEPGSHRLAEITFSGDLAVPPNQLRQTLRAMRVRRVLPGIPGLWKGWRVRPSFSESAVQADLTQLRSFYASRGFFDPELDWARSDNSAQDVSVRFSIRSGPKYRFSQLEFAGLSTTWIPPGPHGEFPYPEFCRLVSREQRLAEKAGVLDFRVNLDIRKEPNGLFKATATIGRGRPFVTGRIEFRGNRRYGDATLRRMLLLNEGEVLDLSKLRASLMRFNQSGLFEPVAGREVTLQPHPEHGTADILITLKEQKRYRWYMSGPAGPLSLGGPLQLGIASRLPSWGQGLADLATYSVSFNLILFSQPISGLAAFASRRHLFPVFALDRPLLPGQRWVSGFTIAPQARWQRLVSSYVLSQAHYSLGSLLLNGSDRPPPAPVFFRTGKSNGAFLCEAPRSRWSRLRTAGSLAMNMLFSFRPF